MEPDIEKILRKKVVEAEHVPVSWNKTDTWMGVSTRVRPERKQDLYYSAAAAIAVFFLLMLIFLSNASQEQMQKQISSLEERILHAEKKVVLEESPEVFPKEMVCQEPVQAPVPRIVASENRRQTS